MDQLNKIMSRFGVSTLEPTHAPFTSYFDRPEDGPRHDVSGDDEAAQILADLDEVMMGAWKARNPNVIELVKAIIELDRKNAPPPPPLVSNRMTATQVTIFDNKERNAGKKAKRPRYGAKVKIWSNPNAADIDFRHDLPLWSYENDLFDAAGLIEKAKALQKTTGYGKVTHPISDDYHDTLVHLARTHPNYHFAPLMASGRFGRVYPEHTVLIVRLEKQGKNSGASGGAIIMLDEEGQAVVHHLNGFADKAAGGNTKTESGNWVRKAAQPLAGTALLQSRTAELPRWATSPDDPAA